MCDTINEAVNSFFTNILNLNIKKAKYTGANFYGTAIALNENLEETQWYLLFQKDTLNEFSKALLYEDNLNEDELDDLIKEVANMIVGSAKVLLEKQNKDNIYTISTPNFLGHVPKMNLLKLEEYLLYKVKNRTFIIGKKAVS